MFKTLFFIKDGTSLLRKGTPALQKKKGRSGIEPCVAFIVNTSKYFHSIIEYQVGRNPKDHLLQSFLEKAPDDWHLLQLNLKSVKTGEFHFPGEIIPMTSCPCCEKCSSSVQLESQLL